VSLEPLKGSPLEKLHCWGNEVVSLEPLKGMPLMGLNCCANQITSLEPLRGMPLKELRCSGNELTSLDPFVENAPETFSWYCESLPTEEIERARDAWAGDPKLSALFRQADFMLAIRAKDVVQLGILARESAGHRYLHVPVPVSWAEAREMCEKLGGHLVTITSAEENDFVTGLVKEAGLDAWIGFTDEGHEGAWEWVTGEVATFAAWAPGQPDDAGGTEHCAMIWVSAGYRWNDHPGDGRFCFIIEWDD
jgi:hypothetical protein